MWRRRRGWRAWLFAAAALALLPPAATDLIFRVPEVMVRHAAAPKPVGTGRVNSSRVNDSEWGAGAEGLLEVHYEEYFVEHEISTADARKAAQALNLDDVPVTREGCGTCSRREMQYCEARVLADHCCCERRHVPEPLPWVPHSCYVGAHRCRPLAGDCARYARLRDCCCYRKLAEKWKGILSSSNRLGVCGASLLLMSMLLLVVRL